jgi:hypothetical protein
MKKNEIVILAVKMLGLYFAIQGFASIMVSFGRSGIEGFEIWYFHLGIFIYFLAGLILFTKASAISKYILPHDDSIVSRIEISENFQTAALRIVGICIAVIATPGLVNLAGKVIQIELNDSELPDYMKDNSSFFIPLLSQVVYFLLGILLALGPGSVVRLLGRFDKTIEKMNT